MCTEPQSYPVDQARPQHHCCQGKIKLFFIILFAIAAGAVLMLIITRVFPKLMEKGMTGMMKKMCAAMKKEGNFPSSVCKKMMEECEKPQEMVG